MSEKSVKFEVQLISIVQCIEFIVEINLQFCPNLT